MWQTRTYRHWLARDAPSRPRGPHAKRASLGSFPSGLCTRKDASGTRTTGHAIIHVRVSVVFVSLSVLWCLRVCVYVGLLLLFFAPVLSSLSPCVSMFFVFDLFFFFPLSSSFSNVSFFPSSSPDLFYPSSILFIHFSPKEHLFSHTHSAPSGRTKPTKEQITERCPIRPQPNCETCLRANKHYSSIISCPPRQNDWSERRNAPW